MRKLNMFLVIGMLITFLAHAIMGAVKIAGAEVDALKPVAWVSVGFVLAHIVVTVILTVQTLQARRRSGAGYFKGNQLFWVRRISGFAILLPLVMHLLVFSPPAQGGAYRLKAFTLGRLISQILLVAAIALHVITNIKPALISFGVKRIKEFAIDILLVLSIVLCFLAIAFVIYYVRWMAY